MYNQETTSRPWQALYGPHVTDREPSAPTMTALLDRAVRLAPERTALQYFDAALSYAEFDRLVGGFAGYLRQRGIVPGDRVAIQLQSSPHFVIAVFGAWKAGCIAVPVNPMYRERELSKMVSDSGARAIVAAEAGYEETVAPIRGASTLKVVLTASELDFQTSDDTRVFGGRTAQRVDGVDDLIEAAQAHADSGESFPVQGPDDVALLCYTSGTSGPPKGARLSHHNLTLGAALTADWFGLGDGTRIFALAPLFHITGLVVEMAQSVELAGTLILPFRLQPKAALDLFEQHQPQFMVGPPTAYMALAGAGAEPRHFASFEALFSGGAPLLPAVVDDFEKRFGKYLFNGYGLTESTAACVFMPTHLRAGTDDVTSALANGTPAPGMDVQIVDDHGTPLPQGERGEIVIRGPLVSDGYWENPEATAKAIRDGWFFTGDIGFFDQDSILFVVDRKKDMIVASGFKVWPGEVEQVLYEHPAVREAAVVGTPDEYRGQTVTAFVALSANATVTSAELVAHCAARMAAYKVPRVLEILDDLPKTPSGKILRRELR